MSNQVRLTERTTPPTEVLVVLPTYNESQNLEKVVAGVRHLGHDVLIVDDASPDGTGEIADQLAGSDPGVRVLHRPSKLGLGSGYHDAFRIGLVDGPRTEGLSGLSGGEAVVGSNAASLREGQAVTPTKP